jgi:hypothetical protein
MLRYIPQNQQIISYGPQNPNELQNQQVYCPNGQIIYNTIMPNQPNVQMTQSGTEISYVPSATTPTRVVNPSAPHTPSPLSQQQQGGHQNAPVSHQGPNQQQQQQQQQQQNVINHIQHNQYTQQPQQNYTQQPIYYITSSTPANMSQHMPLAYTLSQGIDFFLRIHITLSVFNNFYYFRTPTHATIPTTVFGFK